MKLISIVRLFKLKKISNVTAPAFMPTSPRFTTSPRLRSTGRSIKMALPAFTPSTTLRGFTIVELLVVIVVIGVLAAITTVSFTGVTTLAQSASLKSSLSQASKVLETYKIDGSSDETYPVDISSLGVKFDNFVTSEYILSSDATSYCLQGVLADGTAMSIIDSSQTIVDKSCDENGLVGWWKLNSDVADSSGLNNDGTLNGSPTLAIGQNDLVNGAYSFSGTSAQSISMSDEFLQNNITISLWTKLDYLTTSYAVPCGNGLGSGRIGFYVNPSLNTLVIRLNGINNSSNVGSILYQQWAHIATTYDGHSLTLYVNGNLLNTVNVITNLQSSGGSFGIGMVSDREAYFTKGLIDDVRVFNRALFDNEIQNLYSLGAE